MRLVSLLPSATEIVYALELGDQLAGVTFECDEPASARAEKTIVVGGLDTRGMTPREIDDYVRGRLAAGGDLYTLHERALAELQPDVILTQDLCRVCASSPWTRARWKRCWTRSTWWARPPAYPGGPSAWSPGCAPGWPRWRSALPASEGRRWR